MKPPPVLKRYLREVCLPGLVAQTPYFSIVDIRNRLDKSRITYNDRTLVRYLHDFAKAGTIFDSGRGWYSSIEQAFVLDTDPVRDLVADLEKAFPLVRFHAWSTAQVQGAMHHLLGKFVCFVMVEPDSMENVWEHLRESGRDAHLNPRGKEAERFEPRERSVVIRRASVKSRGRGHIAPIENLLVELYFETRDLGLMAEDDYRTMLSNLAGTRRINMASLLTYATERKLELWALLGKGSQLIPPICFRRN